MTLRLGWFTAGRGPGSRGMFERTLRAIDDGTLDASIVFVFMHRERGEGEGSDGFMNLCASRGIPVIALSSQRFRKEHGGDFASHRDEFDRRAVELLRGYEADLGVLAGYLLILSAVLTAAHRFVNLHPALPGGPVGLWQKVIWELVETRADETGNMVFVVTNELDRGPQLTYNRVNIKGEAFRELWSDVEGADIAALQRQHGEEHPLFAAIRHAGMRTEPILLVATLAALADGRLNIDDPPPHPLDLTGDVDWILAGESR